MEGGLDATVHEGGKQTFSTLLHETAFRFSLSHYDSRQYVRPILAFGFVPLSGSLASFSIAVSNWQWKYRDSLEFHRQGYPP